jgi:putative ATP-dependent endonuclease of the OLD family
MNMYIAKIAIENFRNFKNTEIEFNDGVNVIIGPNNAGKTNLIKALSLPVDYQGFKRLEIDDFNKHISLEELKASPPKISIAITISQGQNEELDDLVTVGNWLTRLDDSYEALLTYEYFLPEKEKDNYLKAIAEVTDVDPTAVDTIWKILKNDFIRLFTYKIWGGKTENQTIADAESLQKFDFQFLSAIRDVERDMLSGRNTLLRDVLDFFMDYEIKALPETDKSKEAKTAEIKKRKQDFSDKADGLLSDLLKRMEEGQKHILSYAKNTGASFDKATPNFEGSLSDVEMFSALRLIVEYETGIKIPATHNGLGYNNLIFMSLLLAKMQVNSDGDYLGSNAKVFSSLSIEEPEAHLHPSMQYKFLKFLKENKEKKKVRQIFVTTHSTHITSAVSLDEIICLHSENGQTKIGYPGKVFPDYKSKKYVQQFLDATKSDMLFAQRVILVEGLAEQLLLSILSRYMGKSLEDNHVAVIDVGGRFFDHFLHLFDTQKPYTIPKKIVCLTDRDPVRKPRAGGKFSACYPFQQSQDKASYEYKDNATEKMQQYMAHSNVQFFSQDEVKGKTFEYDLVLHNSTLELLVTESMRNQAEIKDLMRTFKDNKPVEELLNKLPEGTEENPNKKNTEIKQGIRECDWPSDNDKKAAIIASRYLNSVTKGENALELAYALEDNLNKKGKAGYQDFIVPNYIEKALGWICQ